MKMLIKFGDSDVDIIDVPIFVIENAEKLQNEFFEWLYDRNIDHSYWMERDGQKKYGVQYRSDAFIEWLNAFPLKDSPDKSESVTELLSKYDSKLPCLYF